MSTLVAKVSGLVCLAGDTVNTLNILTEMAEQQCKYNLRSVFSDEDLYCKPFRRHILVYGQVNKKWHSSFHACDRVYPLSQILDFEPNLCNLSFQ